MHQRSMVPVLARVLQRPEPHQRYIHRHLVEAGLIAGLGCGGRSAPRVNTRDTARTLVASLGCERPPDAPEALRRALELVAVVGDREQGLVELVEMILDEIVERGQLGEVADLLLHVGYPWPMAVIEMTFADGRKRVVEFHRRDAHGPDTPERRAALAGTFGGRPGEGAGRWASVGLAGLTAVADAIAGRTRRPRPVLADLTRPPAASPP